MKQSWKKSDIANSRAWMRLSKPSWPRQDTKLLFWSPHPRKKVLNPPKEHDAPQKKGRKINVQEPLYDLEALCKRAGMLEYYTGLDRSQFDMLLERLSEVRNGLLLFVVLSFWL
jgi:hypothetical protein